MAKKQKQLSLWCPECKTVFVRFCALPLTAGGVRLEVPG